MFDKVAPVTAVASRRKPEPCDDRFQPSRKPMSEAQLGA